jgi:UDP-N-acetylmuramate--alanine ligase
MNDPMGAIHTIHFVGIGGVGMAGIAEVLINLGYDVQGSDLRVSQATRRLADLGATVFEGHAGEHVRRADVVVVSSAIAADNPEVIEAHRRRIPVVQRAEMLGELMRFRQGIAVAGTHGKTTTTSLVASVLAEGGLDPTFVIGGRLISADANARLGAGRFLVAEADESDASFLHLQPTMAIVTNVDADHLDSYEGDMQRLKQAFIEFLHNLPFYGTAIMCRDDANTAELIPDIGRRVISYGFSEYADLRAFDVVKRGLRTRFKVARRGEDRYHQYEINLPGQHNVRNALAAIAVGLEQGVHVAAINKALKDFPGIDRRLQVLGTVRTVHGAVTFVDDYGHHPTEVAATLAAVRDAWPERRLVVAFQPHRYSRTHALLDDFAQVLSTCDLLVLTSVYAAGEAPIAGADASALARAVRARGTVEPVFVEDVEQLAGALGPILAEGDIVLTLGAGNIGAVAAALPEALAARSSSGVLE